MLFWRGTILLTIYAYKGGGEPKDDMMTSVREGVWIPPKNDGVIYEQPLTALNNAVAYKSDKYRLC